MSDHVIKAAILCAVLFACDPIAFAADASEAGNKIVLESPVMKAGGPMPVDQTQHGTDFSPPLTWKNLPEGTKELALIFEGPVDAESRPFSHWVVYNISATAKGLPDSLPMEAKIEEPKELAGMVQGHTGWGDPGYRGPCFASRICPTAGWKGAAARNVNAKALPSVIRASGGTE
jgi:Raf kinase inhibitor-like YbhB/YbcL family protein